MKRASEIGRRIWPAAGVVFTAWLGILLYNSLYPAPVPRTDAEIDQLVVEAIASATPEPARSAIVYQAILPSLVLIQTVGESEDAEEGVGIGSGVVINERGDILTAWHVVASAAEIEVMFSGGVRSKAELVHAEPAEDIAVLRPIQPPELIVPAVLGSPGRMRVGDETFAIGNPLGLAGSLSAGVISGFDRSIPIDDEGNRLEGLIQFDAAVNPGNSGGPLLNQWAQVIGIVTALANPSDQGFFTGIGFAVPIETAVSSAGAPPR
jgi:S1-C subfamily serine protease